MKSVLETIQAGSAYLEKKGVEDARLNMEHLLAHVLGIGRMDLYLQFDRPLEEDVLEPLRELLRQRGERQPLQHLLGTSVFMGHTFGSDSRSLIPRPETEELVEMLIEQGCPSGGRVIDMATGSGVIGLSLAAAWGDSLKRLVLADLSKDALALARENAARLELNGLALEWVQSDLFAEVEGGFDLVVANLPYVASTELAGLEPELRFEPVMALDGGEDGLAVVRRFVEQLPSRLERGGRLALELGLGQAPVVAAWLQELQFAEAVTRSDLSGHERFVFARR